MSRRLEFTIDAKWAGMSIREFLRSELSFSGHQISRLKFQEDGLRISGEKVYVSHVLREGEVLTVGLTEQVLRRDTEGGKPGRVWEAPAPELARFPLQVLYEDEDLLIVNKPAGLVCHPSPGHYNDTLANQAAAHLGGTGTVMDMRVTGRLDRETSGIVTFAKNTEAAAGIQKQRADGRLVKIYLALAEGDFAEPSYFSHGEWRILCGDLKDHIDSLAGLAYEFFRRELPFDEISIYWLDYFLHNCKLSLLFCRTTVEGSHLNL